MDLKSILPGSEKNSSLELFWALIIEPDWVQAGIWRIFDEKAQVILTSKPSAWKLDEELIQAADVALSSCAQGLPEGEKEPEKTVFGVVSSWVSKGEIKEENLEKIKKICSDLSLIPAGFVVLAEAISHLIKTKEGSPLNAIVLGVYEHHIDISVFKLGNFLGNADVSRSVSILDDLIEGLTRLSDTEAFPSRLVLYNSKEGELEEARQSLVKADWDNVEKIKFLHTPKIEVITPDEKVNAISLAGASEIADVSSIDSVSEDKEDGSEEIKRTENLDNVSSQTEDVSVEELGFVLGKDVVSERPRQGVEDEKKKEDLVNVEEVVEKPREELKKQKEVDYQKRETERPKRKVKHKVPVLNIPKIFGKLKDKLSNSRGKKFSEGSVSKKAGKKVVLLGLVIFLAVILSALAAWWFLPKAEVVVYVTTKRLDEKVTVKIDPDRESADFENGILPGKIQKTQVGGSKTKSTTGTKTVGEKAKGEVTFYRAGSGITLQSGTEITGPNSLRFTLDSDIDIASGSASTPGTTLATVTAADIGAQYNLASSTSFSVSNFSTGDIEAKNDSSFSGGTSREISAISENDLSNLEDDLNNELIEKAEKELSESLDSGLVLIDESLYWSDSSKEFSGKVDDEADTLKLALELDVAAVAVDKKSLNQISLNLLQDKVPDGFVLREEQIKTDFDFEEEDDGVFIVEVMITANLLPVTNPDEIAEKISGKYPSLAQKYLNEDVAGFVRAEIIFKPKLPGKLGTLPRLTKNIQVEVAAER
jgi:hypothetical protein